jgi:hypothetical protein
MRTALLVPLAATLLVAGCGGSPAVPAGAPPAVSAAADAPTAPPADAGGDDADCALSAADLSAATGMTWQFGAPNPGYELETVEGVTADVCGFLTNDRPTEMGDPIVLRVDVVEGAGTEQARAAYERVCTGNHGTPTDSSAVSGAQVCAREGALPDGQIDSGDRVVNVYYVASEESAAAELTASFDKVLAAVR